MGLSEELQNYYHNSDRDQERLKQMYASQQTEIGKASLQARKEQANKFLDQGISVSTQEVMCMVNAKTGEKRYYLKG